MMYRIATYDKNGKFDHYATCSELILLKLHTDGKVYQRSVTNKWGHAGFIYASPYASGPGLFSGWIDISDTHKVEMGVEIKGVKYYENDILRCRYLNTDWDRTDCVVESENYNFAVDTYIVERLSVVRFIGGVVTVSKMTSIISEENTWDISSKALIHENIYLDKDAIIEQMPYQRYDQELVDYLLKQAKVNNIDELCNYMSPVVIGNIHENPELGEAVKEG